ncbi:histone-lysine N-methyltransferase SETMAR [Nephila pilipes]|uniref:Histone-lysine N-methyltransferase SETMAR n=1 Tax=Nephila pilipes TaxID=299642 RepID=A0A8X6TL72_NEPPI|nr:histone-lysine N-methyltransferase SETMAR [Nephila pilipes]
MKYELYRGATTRQAVANINSVFGIQVATNATVALCLKKFLSGDFNLSNEPRGEPNTQVDNDVLKATVKANSSQCARELSLMNNVSKQTILTHLAQIGKVKNLDKWIQHEMTDAQKEEA